MTPPMAPERWHSHEMCDSISLFNSGGSAPNRTPPYMKNTAMLIMAERQLRSSIAAVIKNVTNPNTTPLAPM